MSIHATSSFRAGSFAQLEELIVPKIKAAVTQGTQAVFDESQLLCPVSTEETRPGGPHGELKESGSQAVEWVGTKVEGSITYSAGHASYQEFGVGQRGAASGHGAPGISYTTSIKGQPGTPYMRPALDTSKGAIKDAFAEQGFAT